MRRIFNFSAGPATLPYSVLKQVKSELYNWNNLGISVMEVSHRSEEFFQLTQDTIRDFRMILDIPLNYVILFCHGGARGQFSAVPMNLLKISSLNADYVNSGYWSYGAAMEARKYCNPRVINVASCYDNSGAIRRIQSMDRWDIASNSIYVHYCPNETVDGITIDEIPNFDNKIVVADCSSVLLSRPLDISRFGVIYASAQKNIGVSGATVVIVREDLLGQACSKIPSILNYQVLNNHHSMFNTPSTISWYVISLMLKWLKRQGGLKKVKQYNQKKAELLYQVIDSNDFYYNNVDPGNRSCMNVTFFLKNDKLNDIFLQESVCFGLYGLKGHRVTGGMRASLYNAMTLEGVVKLVEFMNFFSEKYR